VTFQRELFPKKIVAGVTRISISEISGENGSRFSSRDYLKSIGVPEIVPATSPFDPGYDLGTIQGHLEQSRRLMSILKVSMACWMIADEGVTRQKIAAAKKYNVPTTTGGGPFEVACAQGKLPQYLDLVADFGFTRIECGAGFTDISVNPVEILGMAKDRGLEVQFELGKKHEGSFTEDVVEGLIKQGEEWLSAGAVQLVVEARESARGIGLFDDKGNLNRGFADRFANAFGFEVVMFEAPDKPSQFALLDHFGPKVHLCNVRLEELLRVEIYRRGLHSDSFAKANLRPKLPEGL
jgi:phosphosulfolactate synthase